MLKSALFAAAVLAAAPAVHAAPLETKTFPAEKLFPFLSNYYGLVPAKRAHFHLDYRLVSKDPLTITLEAKGAQITVQPAADGILRPLPTADQLKGGQITLTAPKAARLSISMDPVPEAAPAAVMDTGALNLAVSECMAGTKSLAGLLAMMVPNFDRVAIFGVTSAQVKLADGSLKPLPVIAAVTDKSGHTTPAHFAYVPADWPQGRTLVFNAAPTRLAIDTKS